MSNKKQKVNKNKKVCRACSTTSKKERTTVIYEAKTKIHTKKSTGKKKQVLNYVKENKKKYIHSKTMIQHLNHQLLEQHPSVRYHMRKHANGGYDRKYQWTLTHLLYDFLCKDLQLKRITSVKHKGMKE
jgi:hypothetical protein